MDRVAARVRLNHTHPTPFMGFKRASTFEKSSRLSIQKKFNIGHYGEMKSARFRANEYFERMNLFHRMNFVDKGILLWTVLKGV